MEKPKLVSFKLCPFVQRSVITLRKKQIDYDIEYIDLANKPQWFLDISPLGKVPVLKMGDTVLFESAVINEYLDEIYPPSMHPKDPLEKARHRAFIEFCSNLLMVQYRYCYVKDEASFREAEDALKNFLIRLDSEMKGPLFYGDTFTLADTAVAPVVWRQAKMDKKLKTNLLTPKLLGLAERYDQDPSITGSVVEDYDNLYWQALATNGSFLGKQLDSKADATPI